MGVFLEKPSVAKSSGAILEKTLRREKFWGYFRKTTPLRKVMGPFSKNQSVAKSSGAISEKNTPPHGDHTIGNASLAHGYENYVPSGRNVGRKRNLPLIRVP
jgi:hypothetical protein